MDDKTREKIRKLSPKWAEYCKKVLGPDGEAKLIGRLGLEEVRKFIVREDPSLESEITTLDDMAQASNCLECDPEFQSFEEFESEMEARGLKATMLELKKPFKQILREHFAPVPPYETSIERLDAYMTAGYGMMIALQFKLRSYKESGEKIPKDQMELFFKDLNWLNHVLGVFHGLDTSKIAVLQTQDMDRDCFIRWAELLEVGLNWLKQRRDENFPPKTLIKF